MRPRRLRSARTLEDGGPQIIVAIADDMTRAAGEIAAL